MGNNNRKDRVSIRISPNQSLVLKEMSEALDTSISMLIRTIVGDWLAKNEDAIYRIIDKKKYGHAVDKQIAEKAKDIFRED